MEIEKKCYKYPKEYVHTLKILTPREIEVLEKVAEGYTNSEIAENFNLSKKTIEKHRENICHKLKLKGYRGLFYWCKEYIPN